MTFGVTRSGRVLAFVLEQLMQQMMGHDEEEQALRK